MDPNGLSVLSHLRAKPVGKVRRRVRELRTTTATYYGGGGGLPTLDLSHSESQRLAVDALMGERGVQGYRELLTTEGEVDFLSEREKSYILTNQQDAHMGCDSDTVDGEDEHGNSEQYGGQLSLGRFSASEESADGSATLEPSLPLGSLNGSQNGVELSGSDQQSQSRVEVFLQSDNREGSMKDLVREQIRKAKTALVVVVGTFSDVELLCDILEASTMRNVCVYLLLDRLNVQQFLDMCLDLNVNSKHFPKLSVRSVSGHRYCSKTGRWLSGQITQTFIISDWTQVLTGCYSFSWLSWQINRNFIVLLQGRSVTSFHQEFRRLYLSSQPVPPLFHAAMPLTPSASHATQLNPSDSVLRSMPKSQRWLNTGDNGTKDRKKAARGEIPTATEPTHLALSKLEVEHNRAEAYVMTLALCQAPTQAEGPSRWNKEAPRHLYTVKVDRGLSDVNVSRSYRHNITGVDAQWCARGPSALRTQMNPHAGTAKPTLLGTAAVNLDTLRRPRRNDSKAHPRLNVDSQPPPRSLSQGAYIQGNTRGLYIRTQSQRQWPAAQLSPQNAGCRTQSPKCLMPSHPHLWPGAAAKDMHSFLPDTGTDFKPPVNPQPESGFSAAATKGPPPDPQSFPAQQFAPSQRLHWISQLHTRQAAHNTPGVNGTRGRRMMEEPGRRGVGAASRHAW